MNNKIFIVHPKDKSTKFLKRIKTHILHKVDQTIYPIQIFNIYPNNQSHQSCLNELKKCTKDDFIIIMGHGRSDGIYGGMGDFSNSFISTEAYLENPEKYYQREIFIDQTNSEIFQEKKIISITCRSAEFGYMIKNRVAVFLGFGEIRTSIEELEEAGIISSLKLVANIKAEINYIMKRSLVLAINRKYTFFQLYDLIHLITRQRIISITKSSIRNKKLLISELYDFINNMKLLGRGELTIIE